MIETNQLRVDCRAYNLMNEGLILLRINKKYCSNSFLGFQTQGFSRKFKVALRFQKVCENFGLSFVVR